MVRWPSGEKFACCLANILLSACHTKRHINTIVCTHVRFWFIGKGLYFAGYVKQLGQYICYVFHGNHKVHGACKTLANLLFEALSYLRQGGCSYLLLSSRAVVFCRWSLPWYLIFFFDGVNRWGNNVAQACMSSIPCHILRAQSFLQFWWHYCYHETGRVA